MPKFVLRVMTPCSGDVEFESGLWATTREEAMVERVVFTDAEEEKDCHGDVLVELLEKMKRGELEVAR